tara:strand:+ start:95 stop:385 length:291 start_codon:yes stop_codon:yes gene_type:complete
MYLSESIVGNLLLEVEILTSRLKNIKRTYKNTSHNGLRERLIHENNIIIKRLKTIFSIALLREKKVKEKISFSSLLLEQCKRSFAEKNMEKNLFYL